MALTNRALGLEDFRPEKSPGGPAIPEPPESRPASLCHYYQGTFLRVSASIVAGKDTFNFTDKTQLASEGSRPVT